MTKQQLKFKTVLSILHKNLSDIGWSKNKLEARIKKVWDLEGSSNNFTSEEMDILIIICYELAKGMDIELDEDKAIRTNFNRYEDWLEFVKYITQNN